MSRSLLVLPMVAAIGACSPTSGEREPTATRSSAVTVHAELPIGPSLPGDPLLGSAGVRAVWTGTHYVVFTALLHTIFATRVDTAGNALDVPARAIASFAGYVRRFDVAMGSSAMLVAATDDSSDYSARTIVVAPDLTVSPMYESLNGPCNEVATTALGARFLVACADGFRTRITAARVGSDNLTLDATPLELATAPDGLRSPRIATNGTSWMVSWTESTSSGLQLASGVVGADGVITRRGPLPWSPDTYVATSSAWDPAAGEYRVAIGSAIVRLSREGLYLGNASAPPGLSFWRAGAVLHATWASGSEFRDSTVASDGSLSTPAGTVVGPTWPGREVGIASSPSQALIALGASALRMSTSAVAIDSAPRTILFAARGQVRIGSDFDGTRFNVLFVESPGNKMRVARLAPAASTIDGPFDLYAEGRSDTVIAFDGTAHVVAQGSSTGVHVERRASLDAGPIVSTTIGTGVTTPWGIASSGSVTLVGTCKDSSSACGVTRITATGAMLDPTPIAVVANGAIASAGGKFFVVYADWEGVKYYRVSASGVVEDTPPRLLTPLGSAPSIASDGSRVIVAHRFLNQIIARAISPDGSATAPMVVAMTGEVPVAACDGKRTLVAWRGPSTPSSTPILGNVLGPDLTTLHAAPFTITPATGYVAGLASAPGGHFLAMVSRNDPTLAPRLALIPVTVGAVPGEACTSASECETGFCVDGVCCDRACSGQCEACDVPGWIGTCTPVVGTPRGAREPCAPPAGECANRCDGVWRSACTFATATDACSRDACVGGIETHASTCDGAGSCLDVARACGAFACGPTTCRTACAADADCATGHHCEGGACVPRAALATACTDGAQCASGFCTDGVCCDARCDGICEACDVAGSAGTCSPVRGAPRGARPACLVAPSNACSQTVCDGTARKTCNAFVGAEVTCRAATCVDGTSVAEARCDGSGACPMPTTTACASGTCADERTCSIDPEQGGGCGCGVPSRAPIGSLAALGAASLLVTRRRRRLS